MTALDTVQTPDRLIALAIEKGAEIDKLERLFDLQERYNADIARKAYAEAMSALQAELKPVRRNKANNQTGSMYADLEKVIEDLRPLKARYGFSVSFDTAKDSEPGYIHGEATVMHTGGHSERFTLKLPLDTVGIKGTTNKTQVHGTGSAVSYLRRYLEAMIFNVVFTTEDDDGQAAGVSEIEAIAAENVRLKEHNKVVDKNRMLLADIWKWFEEGGEPDTAARAYAELSMSDLRVLNLAPTKGGLLRTDERSHIKGDAEFQALVTKYRNDSGWHNNPDNQL